MNKLLDAYSGRGATLYDERRARTPRWKAEVAAMERYLRRLRPESVIDCPFGTGRWIPQYLGIGAKVLGIDLSDGMLNQARAKLDGLRADQRAMVTLRLASIFDISRQSIDATPDLVVCVRFLNWIGLSDADRAIAALSTLGSQHLIAGVSVIPTGASRLQIARYRLALALINLRGRNGPRQFVHKETDILAVFTRHGWKVAEQALVMRQQSRINFFYRLERLS